MLRDRTVYTTGVEVAPKTKGYALRRHKNLLHFIDAVSDGIGKAVSFLIVFMIVITLMVVVMRYVFRLSFFFDPVAASNNLLSVYVILGAAYALHTRSHVSVDILHRRLSPRARAMVDVATSTLFFLVFIVLLIVLLWMARDSSAWKLLALVTSAEVFTPPAWPIRLIWPIGVCLLLLQGLAKFARDLIIAITGEEEV